MKDRKASENIRYRRMTAEDIAAVHKLSLSVLWPHRLEDWKFIQELGMGIVAEVDAGVLDIPAVNAPDGSLLYFCGPAQGPRQRFESDFTIDARADQALRRRDAALAEWRAAHEVVHP